MLNDKRRNAIKRSKQKALAFAKTIFTKTHGKTDDEVYQLRLDYVRKHHGNRKKCSCPMCCNPRHSKFYKGKGKLTQQELRSDY